MLSSHMIWRFEKQVLSVNNLKNRKYQAFMRNKLARPMKKVLLEKLYFFLTFKLIRRIWKKNLVNIYNTIRILPLHQMKYKFKILFQTSELIKQTADVYQGTSQTFMMALFCENS